MALLLDAQIGEVAIDQACVLLDAAGFRLQRHLGTLLDAEGPPGLRALLHQVGVDPLHREDVFIFIEDLCGRKAGLFAYERRRAATFDCYDMVEQLSKRARPDKSASVTPVVSPPTGGRWPTRYRAALAKVETEEERGRAEHAERQRQQGLLAAELEALELPVVIMARQSMDPKAFLALAAGSHRPGTIRVRLQRWARIRRWMVEVVGRPWPRSVVDLIDHLMDITTQEGATKTAPSQVAGAIAFMEKAGGVQPQQRLSTQQVWLSAVRDAEVRLQSGIALTKQAPRFSLAIVIGLEALVVDAVYPAYKRFVAWTRLVKLWAALRSGDTEAVVPVALRFSAAGLEGTLDRTKTSGPGKRTRHLPFFVVRGAYIVEKEWLEVGYGLLRGVFAFGRDYLLPRPNTDYSGPVRKMATYTDRAAYGRAVLADIQFGGSTTMSRCAALFWSEHSERNFLVSVAAAFGVSKEKRDFLGRWRPGSQSDDYIRTACQVVGGIQRKVAARLRKQPGALDDRPVADALAGFLREKGLAEPDVLFNAALVDGVRPVITPTDAASSSEDEDEKVLAADTPLPLDDENHADIKYWVSHTARRGFRRLHRLGGCWFRPGVKDTLHDDTGDIVYDTRCKFCYPEDRARTRMAQAPSSTPNSSTSSDGDSSSEPSTGEK